MASMVLRVEAKGGQGGTEWDDGHDYDDVTKIHVRGSLEGIQFIQFEYVKAKETTVGAIHGVSSGRGLTQTFEISPSDKEYLVSVDGYYNEATGVIQSIQFTTNKKTSELMGFNKGTKFSVKSTKGKIIGLHGFADKNLNSLGAYVIRVSIKSELIGTQGTNYDDGVYNYDGIRKVYVGTDGKQIRYFKIDYDKAGQVKTHERRDKISEPLHEFAIDYPNEYITYLEGTYILHPDYKCHVLTSIFFKTSKGRHSPIVGLISGTRFVIESPGNVIYGFYGRVGMCVDSIGAYFTPPPRPLTNSIKMDAKGGKGGNEWDDGYDYEGVTKIHVRGGLEGIQFVKFEYVKGGKPVVGPFHGSVSGLGLTQTFEINPSDKEYLVSVDGYYDESTGVIQSIQFITNKKSSEIMGYNSGTKFSLRLAGSMIVGFHGFADKNINSLGAHFIKISIKSELVGGPTTGVNYDDGGYNYDGIRKLYVGSDGKQIRYFKIDYDKAGQMESQERGDKMAQTTEFVVDYPKEYVTSVEGTYAVSEVYKCLVITSVSFKTSKARSSPVVGRVIGTKFVLESQGHSIVGFYGRVGSCIDSIGAYYGPIPTLHAPPEKLEGQGGDGGSPWDDGAFQNVKKVLVGQGEDGIVAVKFVYANDSGEEVEGAEHGKKGLLGYEPFELDYPSEYITSVEGTYDKIMGAENGIITMLKFKTNNRISQPFGLETANKFVLGKEGHKITGFHGKASTTLHQIGVHVVPITE